MATVYRTPAEVFPAVRRLLDRAGGVQAPNALGHYLEGKLGPDDLAEMTRVLCSLARFHPNSRGVVRTHVATISLKLDTNTGSIAWWPSFD